MQRLLHGKVALCKQRAIDPIAHGQPKELEVVSGKIQHGDWRRALEL
jgi:hypothetical protein